MPIDGASAALVVPFLNFVGRAARTGFELASVPAETKDYLQTISDVVNDLKTARELQRQKQEYLTDMDEVRIAKVIKSTEEAMKGLQVLIERPRVDMATNFGGVRASSRIMWVLRDSTKVQAVLSRLQIANQSLHSEIAMMRGIRSRGKYDDDEDDRYKHRGGRNSPGSAPPSYLQATMDAMNERRLLAKARPSVRARRVPSQVEPSQMQQHSSTPWLVESRDDDDGVSASISNIAGYFRLNEEMIASSAPILASAEPGSRGSHSPEPHIDVPLSPVSRHEQERAVASYSDELQSIRSRIEEPRSLQSRSDEPRSLASRLEELRLMSNHFDEPSSETSRSESTRLGEFRSSTAPPPTDPPPYAVSSFDRPQHISPPPSQVDATESIRDTFSPRQRRPRPYNFAGSDIPPEARTMSPAGSVSAFLRRTSPPLEIEYPSTLENPRTRRPNPFSMSDPGQIDRVLSTPYKEEPTSDYNLNRPSRHARFSEHDFDVHADTIDEIEVAPANRAVSSDISSMTPRGRRPPRLPRRPVSNPENPEAPSGARPISSRSVRGGRPSRLDWQVEQQNEAMARLQMSL